MSDQKQHWEEEYERAHKRDADFETLSGEPLKPLYDASDTEEIDFEQDIGTPGHFPYTRGIYTTGYRGRLWTIRQFSGFGDVRAYPPGSHPGIVVLRIADQRPENTLDVLRRFLAHHELNDLAGALTVVSQDRVRIRRTDL